MIAALKMVLSRIPKQWFWSFGFPIILGVIFIVLNAYILAQPIVENDLITLIFILSVGGVVVSFVLLLIIYSLIIIGELNVQVSQVGIVNQKETIEIKKKNIHHNIELYAINRSLWEVKTSVRRKWLPSQPKPDVEVFLEAIKYSPPHCGVCKADLESHWDVRTKFYRCSSRDCENHKKRISEDERDNVMTLFKNQFARDIRNDYKKYWILYSEEYLRLTDGKPEDFKDPVL
jgi:hypothetical protein